MKSLEIVNEKIEVAIYPRGTYTETIWDEEVIINKNELQTIKKDLEVLEIFKALIFHNIHSIGFKSSIKSYEALFNMGIITKEQLDKLKQWLEENDND